MNCTIIQGLENVPDSLRGCVLTVGNFDGVHLGHQRILTVAGGLAASEGAKFCVLTFDPPPAVVLAPDKAPDYILPADEKHRFLAEHGAEVIVVVKPTRQFLAGFAEQFVSDVLVGRFNPKHIVEGPNFFFGHDRSGTVETLQKLAGQFKFDVSVVEPLEITLPGREAGRISSSLIRSLIRSGDVESAGLCLGRHFTLFGTVVAGHGHGRLLEFPTANIDPDGLIIPGEGVYAAWTEIAGERYPSAVSVGTKPTFNVTRASRPCNYGRDGHATLDVTRASRPFDEIVEVHLLDAEGDFYGRDITVAFLGRIRDQQKFPNTGALKEQIAKDVQRVRKMCK